MRLITKGIYIASLMGGTLLGAACSPGRSAQSHPKTPRIGQQVESTGFFPGRQERPTVALPRTILYRADSRYTDCVPVQLGPDGSLVSYPAPTDIPADATPVLFDDGWMLSPVGITASSVFTRWTYEEYRALPSAPSPEEILRAVIPGSRVSQTMTLRIAPSQALRNHAEVDSLIHVNTPKINDK